MFNVEYGLSGGGTTIVPQPNNAMTNIPPGTYQLTVRAFCSVDAAYDVVKTVSNVTVGGNYQVPIATFSTNYSRPSYDICNTGTIVMDVSRGYGGFTFKITAAPVGVTVPQTVTATNAGTQYTLSGLYPAGAYTVEVSDSCYTASASFNLGQITGFPNFAYAPGNFTPVAPYTCSDISWSLGASWDFPQYQSHILAGLYEVAVSIAGDTTGWFEWTGNSIVMN
ncbi:MAG: hypothetical protein LBT24_06360, partial [Tannerella sp.]|nr:hypothetical protein [Tannerella sp.]